MKIFKFIKRSIESFISGHGVHFVLETENGARIFDADEIDDESSESRSKKKKKKKKWQMILPFAILLKLTHLKLMLLKVLLGIGGIQLFLIIGGALLFHYLKNNTLCKIQPHLVHTHSHVAEHTEPEISYSSNYGHSAPFSHYGGSSFASNKDWATKRAYNGYSNYESSTN